MAQRAPQGLEVGQGVRLVGRQVQVAQRGELAVGLGGQHGLRDGVGQQAAALGVQREDGVVQGAEDGVQACALAHELLLRGALKQRIHLLHLGGRDVQRAFEQAARLLGLLVGGLDDGEQLGPARGVRGRVGGELEPRELAGQERALIQG
jgi:hypothetical protein